MVRNGSSSKVKTYTVKGAKCTTKTIHGVEIMQRQEKASLTYKRLRTAAKLKKDALPDDWDYEIQGDPPPEPLPEIPPPDNDNDDDEWVDVSDNANTSGEVLYQHFLDGRDSNRRGFTSRAKDPQGYAARLANERRHWAEQEEELVRNYMEFRAEGAKLQEPSEDVDWFTCTIYDLTEVTEREINYRKGSYASLALVRAGYIPTSSLAPRTAFSIRLLDFYRLLSKYHRRLGLLPFIRALRDYHGTKALSTNASTLSKAFDCYLSLRRSVTKRIDWALGRDGENARLVRACPACFYELEGEERLEHHSCIAADGNMSQKRFKSAGSVDKAEFPSTYFISRKKVEEFADVAQVRKARKRVADKGASGGADTDIDAVMDADKEDAEMEIGTVNTTSMTRANNRRDGGIFPMETDPLSTTFDEIVSECVERWKANSDDEKKTMWDCFDECGIFVLVCRHGHIFDGERHHPKRGKHIHPKSKLVGYDIGCTFKHTARRGVPDLDAQFVVPAMHGYAHNRACQLEHHPKYVKGAGIEDFETCERVFSVANGCAGITRYTTPFHRHQLLDTHFTDWDEGRRLYIGKFIYSKYKEAGGRISQITETFTHLKMLNYIHDGTFNRYLQEERHHLTELRLEPLEDQSRFTYVQVLEKYWKTRGSWEEKAGKAGIAITLTPLEAPLPADLKKALTSFYEATAECEHFERILGIQVRWEADSTEYLEARKWANERKYRLALDNMERLVIQRIFELQKANLVGTAYKMREQISSHLKTRSATIRAAIKTYNKAAAELRPPRDKIEASSVLDMAFLAQFDLLRYSRPGHDIRSKPWADPATRVLTDKYFELQRSKEEIQRLNIEWRRVRTWLQDEEKLFLRAIKCLQLTEDLLLSELVKQRWEEVQKTHKVIWHWLYKAQSLPHFSALISPGSALLRERVNQELSDTALLARDPPGNEAEQARDQSSTNPQAPNETGDAIDSFLGPECDDANAQFGCLEESRDFDSFIKSLGRMCL